MLKSKKKLFFSNFLILLILIPNNSCASILTVFKPIGFIMKAIAHNVTKVEIILPNGKMAKNYYLSPLDLIKIKHSDLVILIGGEIEPFIFKKAIKYFRKKTIILSEIKSINKLLIHNFCLKKKQKNTLQNQKEINNMNIWLSPKIALKSAIVMHDALLKLIPQKKKIINENLKNFKKSLFKANKDIKKKISYIKKIKYFTFDNSYKYFEKFYGLHPLKRFLKYPDIKNNIQYLYEIKNQLLKTKTKCILTEPQFNSNIINIIIHKMKIQKGKLDLFGTEIPLIKNSYMHFLLKLSDQYISCLKNI